MKVNGADGHMYVPFRRDVVPVTGATFELFISTGSRDADGEYEGKTWSVTIGVILILILTTSCSSRQLTLEEYANQRVKIAMQKVSHKTIDFTLNIPVTWDWKVESYENEKLILGIDACSESDKDGYIDIISIQKTKSFGSNKNLESEFKYLLNSSVINPESRTIVESGETNILKQKAYFIHSKSDTGTYGEVEMINFILDSGTDGVFYHLYAGASQTVDLNKNMALLIQSLKTFEINSIEY